MQEFKWFIRRNSPYNGVNRLTASAATLERSTGSLLNSFTSTPMKALFHSAQTGLGCSDKVHVGSVETTLHQWASMWGPRIPVVLLG